MYLGVQKTNEAGRRGVSVISTPFNAAQEGEFMLSDLHTTAARIRKINAVRRYGEASDKLLDIAETVLKEADPATMTLHDAIFVMCLGLIMAKESKKALLQLDALDAKEAVT